MAKVNGGAVIAPKNAAPAAAKAMSLNMMVKDANVQERFQKMLGKKSAGFLSSLLTVVRNNDLLAKADPSSVLAAAATAAALDLPVNPSLGMAYVVPYGSSAQFQIGYKGLITLAQRTGCMKSIVMTPVYEGEIRDWNRFTETYTPGDKLSGKIVGYYARFETVNGFAKAAYWTVEAVTEHAIKFNPMCQKVKGLAGNWKKNFDAMACKTVLKSILGTYAPLSIEMQMAISHDDSTIKVADDGELVASKDAVDVSYEEVATPANETEEKKEEEIPFDDEPGAPTKEEQQEILNMMGD